jgi:hypothetical protein
MELLKDACNKYFYKNIHAISGWTFYVAAGMLHFTWVDALRDNWTRAVTCTAVTPPVSVISPG